MSWWATFPTSCYTYPAAFPGLGTLDSPSSGWSTTLFSLYYAGSIFFVPFLAHFRQPPNTESKIAYWHVFAKQGIFSPIRNSVACSGVPSPPRHLPSAPDLEARSAFWRPFSQQSLGLWRARAEAWASFPCSPGPCQPQLKPKPCRFYLLQPSLCCSPNPTQLCLFTRVGLRAYCWEKTVVLCWFRSECPGACKVTDNRLTGEESFFTHMWEHPQEATPQTARSKDYGTSSMTGLGEFKALGWKALKRLVDTIFWNVPLPKASHLPNSHEVLL